MVMWDSGVSWGCLLLWLLWGVAFGLIAVSASTSSWGFGQVGLATTAAAAALTIIRDNQRTRRLVRSMRETSQLSRIV